MMKCPSDEGHRRYRPRWPSCGRRDHPGDPCRSHWECPGRTRMPAQDSASCDRAGTHSQEGITPKSMEAGIRFSFNCAEEGWQLIDPPDETANIQLEVRVLGVLDE